MTIEQLWNELCRYKTKEVVIFSKPYISLEKADFEHFDAYFKPQFALLNPYDNRRSFGWYKHIHAVIRNHDVQIHIDRFNPNSHFLLNIPHGFVDVVPYFLWCWAKRVKPFDV